MAALAVVLALLAGFLFWPESAPRPSGRWLREGRFVPRRETVAGLRVRYVRLGSGAPVVLLHGIASSIYTWKDVLPALARSHDVVALDLPGFGGSDVPPALSVDLYVRLLPALLERLGLRRASLVGHSLGGALAAVTAAQRPDLVDRLVLVSAAGYNLRPRDQPLLVRLMGRLPSAVAAGGLPRPRLLVALALRQVFHDDRLVTEERREEYLAPLVRPGAAAALRSLVLSSDQGSQAAVEQAISAVRAPTLIIWGREDVWIPVADASRFEAAIPGSRSAVLEACGHLPQEEKPAETARLLDAFLR
jgi:pimeloyl-ACP methyl ester carboxylesterase